MSAEAFWQTTWNVCRIRVCRNTRGSSRKRGQGPLSQQRWRGGLAASWLRGNMTWGPPASSHRITCDRGEPPPHKSPPLLLFSPFSPFISPRLLSTHRLLNEIKINHTVIAWLCLSGSPRTLVIWYIICAVKGTGCFLTVPFVVNSEHLVKVLSQSLWSL